MKWFKKLMGCALSVLTVLSLAACAGGSAPGESGSVPAPVQGAMEESSAPAENAPGGGEDTAPGEEPGPEKSRVLVAYFSATGSTAGVAQKLAGVLGADLVYAR